jgi:glycosyltransferase involved in cell wall biosynthesis
MERDSSLSLDDIWCVIPVYSDRVAVEGVANECRNKLPHVLVVADGNADTDIQALFAKSDITVLRHERNRGKGRSILAALEYVKKRRGRFLITIDADGQHDPQDLEKFLPLIAEDDTAIVIGSRNFNVGNVPKSSAFKRKIGNFLLRLETGVSIEDCQGGFRVYPVEHLSQLRLTGAHFDFEAEVLARASWAGLKLKSVPLGAWFPEPEFRTSRVRPIVDNLRLIRMHARLVGRRLLPIPSRRLLPSTDGRVGPRILLHPIRLMKTLLKENATPGLLGASASIGTFLAVLPLVSIHTLVIIYVATRLRLNAVMAISIQHLCMPPFVPMICIELGYYMRHGTWLTDFSSETVLRELHHRLFEWLLGSLIVAPLAALFVGAAVYLSAFAIQNGRRSQKHRAGAPSTTNSC